MARRRSTGGAETADWGREPALPPLNLVRSFEAACRLGSMRRAAKAIGISHCVVSRNVRYLEDWMGVPLLRAGPRGVSPTADGAALYETVRTAFGLIAAATDELRAPRRGRPLRIGAVAGLASKWLTPRLSQIEALLDGRDVRLGTIDPGRAAIPPDVDIAITYATFDRLPPGATRLISPRVFPVISKRWMAGFADIGGPADLAGRALVHEESREQWQLWLAAAGTAVPRRLAGPILSDATLAYDAAEALPAVVLATHFTLPNGAGDGRLVELFDTDIRLGWYVLTVSDDLRREPAVIAFIDWMTGEMTATESAGRVMERLQLPLRAG